MRIKSILLATAAILSLSTTAFAADKESYESNVKVEKDSDGNYEEKSKVTKTDMGGTTSSSEKKMKVEVDAEGNIDKSKTTKDVTDPKGLGNSRVVKTSDSEKTKDGEVTTKHEKSIDGKTVEGTKDSYKSENSVQKDSKGNYEEKDTTIKTDASGTTTKFEKKVNVDVDASGDTDKSTTTKQVKDPKGLNNSTTVKTSNTEKVKDGVVKTSKEVTVDGKTTESKTETAPE